MYGELEEDGALYIAMELLEGKNLNQLVRKGGPLAAERAVPIVIQVCGALQEAHDRGIVHRDLKPENIFLCSQGGLQDVPKVLDFGLAKTDESVRPGALQLTQEGMVFGTPEFMSPEQAQGKILDARSDIYSLAIILYEVLTGKLPFVAKSPMEYIQKHVVEPPIPLNQRVAELQFPPALEAVLARAMAKRLEDRYQSVRDFGQALADAMGLSAASLAFPTATPAVPGVRATVRVGAQSVSTKLLVGVALGSVVVGVLIAVVVMMVMR